MKESSNEDSVCGAKKINSRRKSKLVVNARKKSTGSSLWWIDARKAYEKYMDGKVPKRSLFVKAALITSFCFGFSFCLSVVGTVILLPYTRVVFTFIGNNGSRALDETTYWLASPTLMCCVSVCVKAYVTHKTYFRAKTFPDAGPEFALHAFLSYLIPSIITTLILPLLFVFVFNIEHFSYYTLQGAPLAILGIIIGLFVDDSFRSSLAHKLYHLKQANGSSMTSLDKKNLADAFFAFYSRESGTSILGSYRHSKRSIAPLPPDISGTHAVTKIAQKAKSTISRMTNYVINALAGIFHLIVLYPMYQRSSSSVRFIYVFLVHPMMEQTLYALMRTSALKRGLRRMSTRINEDDNTHSILNYFKSQAYTFVTMALLRRCLVSNMKTQESITLSVIVISLEQLVFRSSMRAIDNFIFPFESALKDKNSELLRRAIKLRSRLYDFALRLSIICELSAIFMRAILMVMLQNKKFIFGVGFGAVKSDDFTNLISVSLETFCEMVTALMVVYVSLNHGWEVEIQFDEFRNNSSIHSFIVDFILGIFLVLSAVFISPVSLLCDDARDACSCTSDIYDDWCNATIANASVGQGVKISSEDLDVQGSTGIVAIGLGLFVMVGLGGVTLALNLWVKSRRHRRIATNVQRELKEQKSRLEALTKQMSIGEQERVRREMEESKFSALEPYSISHSHVTLDELIARGAVGEVWIGTYRAVRVAVKKVVLGKSVEEALENFRTEAMIMAELQGDLGISHPNLVQMLHCCYDREFLIILKHFELGSLDSQLCNAAKETCTWRDDFLWSRAIPTISPNKAAEDTALKNIIKDIVAGMAFCHLKGIIHRDLKPQNVLLSGYADEPPSSWRAKITDFGEATQAMFMGTTTMKGSPMYMAPEVILTEAYDHTVDIWSFGMLLLHCISNRTGGLTGCWKRSARKIFSLEAVATGSLPSFDFVEMSEPHAVKLVRMCLKYKPEERIKSFDDILPEITTDPIGVLQNHVHPPLKTCSSHAIKSKGSSDVEKPSVATSQPRQFDDKIVKALRDKVTLLERKLKDSEMKMRLVGHNTRRSQKLRKRKAMPENDERTRNENLKEIIRKRDMRRGRRGSVGTVRVAPVASRTESKVSSMPALI